MKKFLLIQYLFYQLKEKANKKNINMSWDKIKKKNLFLKN